MDFKTYKRHVNLGLGLEWDQEYIIAKDAYLNNGTLALLGFLVEDGVVDPDCDTFTVNLPETLAIGNSAYLDTNKMSHIDEWFVSLGVAEVVGSGASGYCVYPLLEFDKDWVANLPTTDEVYEHMEEVCYA